jgi:hypothetical protein
MSPNPAAPSSSVRWRGGRHAMAGAMTPLMNLAGKSDGGRRHSSHCDVGLLHQARGGVDGGGPPDTIPWLVVLIHVSWYKTSQVH